MPDTENIPAGAIVKPVPDPSTLTTEQMLRETQNVIALLKAEIDGHGEADTFRFEAIKERLDMMEEWRKELKADATVGINAALQSAKEASREQVTASEKAIAKSEAAMTKQSEQQYATFTESLKGLSDKFDAVKERLDRFESVGLGMMQGQSQQRQTHSVQRQEGLDSRTIMFAIISVLLTLTGMGITITIAVTR